MTPHRIVVLGAGFAGLAAAKRAARRLRGTAARVTLVNAAEHFVERTRLHQVAAGQRLPEIRIADLLHGSGVEAVFGRVTAIDPDACTVHVEGHEGPDPAAPSGEPPMPGREPLTRLHYDTLVYALGSSWDTRGVPGVAEHAFAVADAEQAARLRDHLGARLGARPGGRGDRLHAQAALPRSAAAPVLAGADPAASRTVDTAPAPAAASRTRHRIVVAGGGLTGLEAAAELAEAHPAARVELVSAEAVADWLAPRALRHLRGSLRRLGVTVREHTEITAVQDGRALVGESDPIAFDTLVWTAGFRVHPLAAEAGLAVDSTGRMLVDPSLRSVSHPEVIAAGDAAAAQTRGGVSRMTCQTGLPMGLHAGGVAADAARRRAPRPVRLCYVALNISLGRRDAVTQFLRADDTPVRATLVGRSSAALKEGITRGVVAVLRHPGPYLPGRA
ncbi:NAD(P)/FAD-dependent oxidoreductase [Streptomonospora wellingtoniae]|uniref:FAD-dependent oxidoreductase n=1 Tax=Streptomonospora wellingtoniae TaxID=3075544 RepID=A0ABU2KNQ7_9ACTN|nr:FAD-dependent oxidoreductase [Streptomonospora sp. DSM 45055]MDT0300773.1 FAD-dependent oxidoreductase [Streptomonospora sp. DSM 45055]